MKDAYYFPHDSNARNDQRLLKVRFKHGASGYGAFFMLLEIMREQGDYRLSMTDLEMIDEMEIHIGIDSLIDIVENYDLFELDGDYFYSNSFDRRMQKMNDLRDIRAKAGRKGGKSRPTAKQNPSKTQALKEIILKESKSNNIKSSESDTLTEIETIVDDFYIFQMNQHPNKYPNFKKRKESLYRDSISTIDKLVRIDGYTLDKVKGALTYAVRDDFWSVNTLSLSGLRKKSQNGLMKFENLFAKYEQGDKGLKYERFANGQR